MSAHSPACCPTCAFDIGRQGLADTTQLVGDDFQEALSILLRDFRGCVDYVRQQQVIQRKIQKRHDHFSHGDPAICCWRLAHALMSLKRQTARWPSRICFGKVPLAMPA
jgi:hypothetical protein